MKIASNIYQFNDYRNFLKDRYAQLKSADATFSFRNFSKQAGFGSPNYLKLVMDGKRNLSEEAIEKFARGLRLDNHESEYFHFMVMGNQCSDTNKKRAYEAKLSYLRELFTVKDLIPELYDYYHDWYHAAIREMVSKGGEVSNNAEAIAQNLVPAISTEKAQASIDLLQALKFVKVENGKLVSVEQANPEGMSNHLAQKIQHEQMAELAAQSIFLQDGDNQGFESVTVSLPADKLAELKSRVHEMIKELSEQNSGTGNAVYQLNIQLFALTKPVSEEKTVELEVPTL